MTIYNIFYVNLYVWAVDMGVSTCYNGLARDSVIFQLTGLTLLRRFQNDFYYLFDVFGLSFYIISGTKKSNIIF